jgi:hypothetical protein
VSTGYIETYRRSLERPQEFWAEAAEAIDWEQRWDRVLDDSRPRSIAGLRAGGSILVGMLSTAMWRLAAARAPR